MENKVSIPIAKMFCPSNDPNILILFRHLRPELDSFVGFEPDDPVLYLDYGFHYASLALSPLHRSDPRPETS